MEIGSAGRLSPQFSMQGSQGDSVKCITNRSLFSDMFGKADFSQSRTNDNRSSSILRNAIVAGENHSCGFPDDESQLPRPFENCLSFDRCQEIRDILDHEDSTIRTLDDIHERLPQGATGIRRFVPRQVREPLAGRSPHDDIGLDIEAPVGKQFFNIPDKNMVAVILRVGCGKIGFALHRKNRLKTFLDKPGRQTACTAEQIDHSVS